MIEAKNTLTGNPALINSGFDSPPDNPLVLLKDWFKQAENLKIVEARAMVLSTVNVDHKPSNRVVLITNFEDGIVFGTHEESRKGREIANNPYVAGNLFWRETMQQINFQGIISQLSDEESDCEFAKRIPEAQAVTVCATPSAPMLDEIQLKKLVQDLLKQKKIDRPQKWHLYQIKLEHIEFWVGSQDRFHQRLRYDLINNIWQHQRLQP